MKLSTGWGGVKKQNWVKLKGTIFTFHQDRVAEINHKTINT